MNRLSFCLVALAASLLTLPAGAADPNDWPQWRGPHRDGKGASQGLLATWPEGGPRLVWTSREVGRGYSSPSVVGDAIVTMGVVDEQESVLRLALDTGEVVWTTPLDGVYENAWGGGPRSSPTIDGDRLYALAGRGVLAALDLASGEILWQKNLVKDFGGEIPRWGYSESVLIDGDSLAVKPGAGTTAVLLNKHNGEVLWKTQADQINDEAAYASFIKAELGGRSTYVTMTGGGLVGLDTESGQLLFRYTKTANNIAVIPTPVVDGDLVYSTSGYGTGSALISVQAEGNGLGYAEQYFNKVMKNHHGGVILHDNAIFGYSDGRGWICQDLKNGEAVWSERNALDKGAISYADGRFYCYGERDGDCVLIEATRDGWKEQGRFRIPETTDLPRGMGQLWTQPVLAQGRQFLRDQDLLFAFDVSKP